MLKVKKIIFNSDGEYRRYLIVIAMILLTVFYLFLAYHLPLSTNPDEILRYKNPLFIYENSYLPSGYDKRVMLPFGNYSYAFYPQWLGALISAFFMKVMSIFSTNGHMLLFASRWTSILFGILTVIFTGMTSKKLFRSNEAAILSASLVAFLPQLVYLSAYVNNDIIAIAGVSIIIYALVGAQVDNWNLKYTLLFSLGCICDILGYLNSIPFVFFGLVYGLFTLVMQSKNGRIEGKKALVYILCGIVIVLVIVLPFFIRNYLLYKDFLGTKIFDQRYEAWIKHGGYATLFPYHGSWQQLLFRSVWFKSTLMSSIGLFGYMNVVMRPYLYALYYLLFAIGIVLFCIGFRREKAFSYIKLFHLLMFVACLLTIVLSLYRSKVTDFQAQGRYVMTIVPILSIWITSGYNLLINRLKFRLLYPLLSVGYILLGIVICYHYIYLVLV
jgi:hypothetical protein